jgi:hypothetical protein
MNFQNESAVAGSYEAMAREEGTLGQIKLAYNHVHYFFTVVFVPAGILANFLTILIYNRKELNKNNTGFLNKCIAITNVIILLFHLFVIESKFWFGFDLLAHSNVSCKVLRVIKKATREVSPMIETGLVLSRYFEVFRPKQFMFMHNKSFLVTSIISVYMLLFLINAENLFYFKSRVVYMRRNVTFHEVKCTSVASIVALSEVISAIFRSILPSIAMFTLNILIIAKLYQSKIASNRQTRPKRELKFTRTTLLRNLVFILLNLPYTIVSITKIVYLLGDTATHSFYMYKFDVYLSVCYDISTFYYVSFMFMNMAFNKLFMREILVMLGLRASRNRLNTYGNSLESRSCLQLTRRYRTDMTAAESTNLKPKNDSS